MNPYASHSMQGPSPETLLDLSSDIGVAPMSAAARRVLEKYSGAAAVPPRVNAEPVLVAKPVDPHRDAPLTYNEQKAKAVAMGRAAGQMAAALGAAHAAAIAATFRASKPEAGPRRLRSIASARAAREQEDREALPMGFGGLAVEEVEPIDRAIDVDDASPTWRAPYSGPPLPEFEALWTASLDDGDNDARVFSVRISTCGTLVAAGCGDGVVRVLHAGTGRPAYVLDSWSLDNESGAVDATPLPATCLRWRSGRALLIAKAAGSVERWQTGSTPKRLHALTEADNQIYALDGGERYVATGGKDTAVRLYDEGRMQLVLTLGNADAEMRRYEGLSGGATGHTSRVFALRFVPDQPSLLASAGWDQTVRVWDVRSGKEVMRLADSHHVCGDSIDAAGNELLIGAWGSGRLALYDLRTSAAVQPVPWRGAADEMAGCKYYAAQFSAQRPLVAAAGVQAVGGQGEVRLLSRDGDVVGRALLPKGVYGVDTAARPSGEVRMAITADESVVMLEASKAAVGGWAQD